MLEYRQPNENRSEVDKEVERQGDEVPLVQTCVVHVLDESRQKVYDVHGSSIESARMGFFFLM